LKEFIEGAARLRGGAKALDIWRLETKAQAAQAERIHGFTVYLGKPSILVIGDGT